MRVVAAVVLAVVLAGCGGEERARTVAAPTTASPVEGGDGGDTLTQTQLEAALLTVADLPTGYTAVPDDGEDDDDDEDEPTSEDAACAERFDGLDVGDLAAASAEAEFEGGYGVLLQQKLSSFEDQGELEDRLDEVVDVLSDCPRFTITDDGVTTDVTIGQLSFPELGDDTVALAFDGTSEQFDVRLNLVFVRLGHNLMSIGQGGLTADAAALEQATRTGLDKLETASG